MKIIIVGAGISGLTTYLSFKKHLLPASDHSIVIYEAYDTAKLRNNTEHVTTTTTSRDDPGFLVTAIGNALGVSSNGLNVLRRLDPELLSEIVAKGCPVNTWKITNARGWKLVDVDLTKSGSKAQKTTDDLSGIMVSRQALWGCLLAKVPDEVIRNQKVSRVEISEQGRNSVVFTDGTCDDADLIIGADGLRSMVRTAMFHDEKANGKDYITPQYEGLVGVGSFIPSSVLQDCKCIPGTMNLVFGPNGFFGYGYITSNVDKNSSSATEITPGPTAGWWSTFHRSECPDSRDFDRAAALAALNKRHRNWKNTTVQHIVKAVSESSNGVEDMYPTWTTPELPTWEKNGCILVGDAAHALQPSSGQGTSQAFEDVESLTLLLKHYLGLSGEGKQKEAVESAAKKYVKMREPRLHEIYVRSQQMGKMKGDMGFVMEMIMYLAIYLMSFFHDTYNEKLMNYDVPSEVQKVLED